MVFSVSIVSSRRLFLSFIPGQFFTQSNPKAVLAMQKAVTPSPQVLYRYIPRATPITDLGWHRVCRLNNGFLWRGTKNLSFQSKGEKAMGEKATIKAVYATLEKDPRINLHRYPISIAMQNGDLILQGEVENIAAKKLALVAAAEISGVRRIVDRLRVHPR
jgi:hypothetical protein